MPICILKFDDEDAAKAAFTAASEDIDGDVVLFKGLLPAPESMGSSTMVNSFYLIANSIELPTSLMAFEYDYSYPVAESISLNLG